MTIWTKEEEAEALKKRFAALKESSGISRAAFARAHGIKGKDSIGEWEPVKLRLQSILKVRTALVDRLYPMIAAIRFVF